jgi:hypothetical protein
MANLELYRYSARPVDINGTPILVTSPATFVPVDQTTPGVTLAGVDLSTLDSSGYLTNYPLLMKLFCKDIRVDNTGMFIVSVNGSATGTVQVCDRQDNRNFAMTWYLGHSTGASWDTITNSDATVSLKPIFPMTAVSLNCILGIATDNIDKPEEN